MNTINTLVTFKSVWVTIQEVLLIYMLYKVVKIKMSKDISLFETTGNKNHDGEFIFSCTLSRAQCYAGNRVEIFHMNTPNNPSRLPGGRNKAE